MTKKSGMIKASSRLREDGPPTLTLPLEGEGEGGGGYVKGFFVGILLIGLVLTLGTLSAALALTEEETKRAEALIPLLDGEQEFWAIGEFVHIGPPAIPVLAKGVRHPNRRVRINAIETMSMIKDKAAVPILNAVAANEEEIPAVREKALRVAIRLDPAHAGPALEAVGKDPSETIRNAVVSESRIVKDKAGIYLLITLLADEDRKSTRLNSSH